jgi:nucleotide-binding universal stress UspA family protein
MVTPLKQRLLNILLADDGSENMQPAIQILASLAHDPDCTITTLRVFPSPDEQKRAEAALESGKTSSLLQNRAFHFQSKQVIGNPSEQILHFAGQSSPDLLVLGSKATGRLGGLLGNVATDVLHAGEWPVLIVRGACDSFKKILLVTDGSSSSRHTCEFLSAFPLPDDASLEILHVVVPVRTTYPVEPAGLALPILSADDEARINQENVLHGQDQLERANCNFHHLENVKLTLRMGEPLEQIQACIKSGHIDLLVCGSRGSGNLTGWLMGSISRELVQHAPCSILVVRTPPG